MDITCIIYIYIYKYIIYIYIHKTHSFYNYITIYVYKPSYPTIYLGQKQLYPTVFYISFMERMGYKTSRISGYTTTV